MSSTIKLEKESKTSASIGKRGNSASLNKISGKITDYIGTGENAKNSIVYLVIKYSFWVGLLISIVVVINYWLFRDIDNKVPDIVGDLKVMWEIVTPIITLALGYAFGKSEK